MNLRSSLIGCFAIAWLVLQGPALGAEYPEKPVRLVVPFAAGGTTDTVARVVAVHLSLRLGQPVVVENRPGAGSAVGAEAVSKAPADANRSNRKAAAESPIQTNARRQAARH